MRQFPCWALFMGLGSLNAQAPAGDPHALAEQSATTTARFAAACALQPTGPHRDLACNVGSDSPASADAFLTRLPVGGDYGMPDPWSALAVARAHFVAAGERAWSDSGWDRQVRLHRRPAISALRRALHLQPGFLPALALFEGLSPYPHLWASPNDELREVRAVPASALPASLWPLRIMLELEAGTVAQASAVLDSLRIDHGSDPVVRYLTAVVAASASPTPVAWQAYRHYLDQADTPSAIAWGSYDALLAADSSERHELLALPASERSAWLRLFWESRDQQTAAVPGTRWVDHQRRYLAALREYRAWPVGGVAEEWRPTSLMMLPPTVMSDTSLQLEAGDPHRLPHGIDWYEPLPPDTSGPAIVRRVFDDRGAVYLRHGAPLKSIEYVTNVYGPADPIDRQYTRLAQDRGGNPTYIDGKDTLPITTIPHLHYATWVYGNGGYRSVLSFGQMTTGSPAMWAFDFPRGGDLMTPCGVEPRFCTAILGVAARDAVRTDGHDALVREVASDDDEPRVNRPAGLLSEAYGLPGGGVLVVYAVPLDSLVDRHARSLPPPRDVTVHLAASLARAGRGILARIDTSRSYALSGEKPRGRFASGWFTVPASPGVVDVTVSAFSADSSVGDFRRHNGVAVPEFDGQSLAIGQPIIGREASGLRFTRHGVDVALNPTNAWRQDEPATLYAELDGLVPGHSYETTIEVWPSGAHATRPRIAIATTARASQPTSALQRSLGLQQLDAGAYRVVTRVRDTVTGATVSSEGYLNVVKSGRQ